MEESRTVSLKHPGHHVSLSLGILTEERDVPGVSKVPKSTDRGGGYLWREVLGSVPWQLTSR